jgi:hypothetical protein
MEMAHLKGITVTLYDKVQSGNDAFNKPIYTETAVAVENVLVAPASSAEVINEMTLSGKKAVYTMAIPKGDTHTWDDRKVEFYGETWHTFGFSTIGIEEMIPLDWNRKVQVERYG